MSQINDVKYQIVSSTGHGKNVKGNKKTSTIQVRELALNGDYFLRKQYRFVMGDDVSRQRAIDKAKKFVTEAMTK